MKLTIEQRNLREENKGESAVLSAIRAKGFIPAVLYGCGKHELISVKQEDFERNMRDMKKEGRPLATTVFQLSDGRKALIKDIHQKPSDYVIQHLDLYLVEKDKPVAVNVPLHVEGIDSCQGIKLGGFLRQVVRSVRVKCLPDQVPQKFVLDVSNLNIFQSLNIGDIAFPESIVKWSKSLLSDKVRTGVAVSIAKK
jgi:large subunit ribosomal protein L25